MTEQPSAPHPSGLIGARVLAGALGLPLPQLLPRIFIGITVFGFAIDVITTIIRLIRQAVSD